MNEATQIQTELNEVRIKLQQRREQITKATEKVLTKYPLL